VAPEEDASDVSMPRFPRSIEARRVFSANARTKRTFGATIVGHFRRRGPNPWDEYTYVAEDGGPIDVFPGIKVQVEPRTRRFRMRARGKVVMAEWLPRQEEADAQADDAALAARFLDHYVDPFQSKAGIGVAAFIGRTLRSR
jgi:hypothetical protein